MKGGPPSPKQIATFSHISVTPLGSVHIRAGINKQTIESRSQNFHSSSQRMECQVERYHGCCIISARFLLSLSTALLFSLLANLFLLAVFLLFFFFLIDNIIPTLGLPVASPSVTCVRQEESNYCILALRSACLLISPSCYSIASSSNAAPFFAPIQWPPEEEANLLIMSKP